MITENSETSIQVSSLRNFDKHSSCIIKKLVNRGSTYLLTGVAVWIDFTGGSEDSLKLRVFIVLSLDFKIGREMIF